LTSYNFHIPNQHPQKQVELILSGTGGFLLYPQCFLKEFKKKGVTIKNIITKGSVCMKIVAKKVVIYSMLGLMQVGMFSSVAAAAPGPLHNDNSQRIAYLDRDDRHDRDNDRKHKHDERKRQENERHEREMKRRPHESNREWRERQEHEKDRHDKALREIAAFLIGIAIGSGSSDN
jgi:hypothetical protein